MSKIIMILILGLDFAACVACFVFAACSAKQLAFVFSGLILARVFGSLAFDFIRDEYFKEGK